MEKFVEIILIFAVAGYKRGYIVVFNTRIIGGNRVSAYRIAGEKST